MFWFIPPVLWLAYAAFGPVRLTGKSNMHNAYVVWLTLAPMGDNHQPSVIVQEIGEWRLHKLIGIAAYFPVALIDPLVGPFLGALAMLLADGFSRKVKRIDWAGHGAEVMAAEKAGIAGYREAEAERVARDYKATPADALLWFDQMRWLSRIIYALGQW